MRKIVFLSFFLSQEFLFHSLVSSSFAISLQSLLVCHGNIFPATTKIFSSLLFFTEFAHSLLSFSQLTHSLLALFLYYPSPSFILLFTDFSFILFNFPSISNTSFTWAIILEFSNICFFSCLVSFLNLILWLIVHVKHFHTDTLLDRSRFSPSDNSA